MSDHRPNRRQLQAEATRRDILAAARQLFATQGYAATSMAAIAAESGAAIQTIYSSVGSKHAILLALVDLMDEEAGVGPMWQQVATTNDPVELVGLGVSLTRQFIERFGDILWTLMSAASFEPDVAITLAEAKRRHRVGLGRLVGRIAEKGGLREGLAVDRASDIFALLSSMATYQQLLDDHGWSLDECETWIVGTIRTSILSEPRD